MNLLKKITSSLNLLRPSFIEQWVSMIQGAMTASGKGYRFPSMKRDAADERRKDKKGLPNQTGRRYMNRYDSPAIRNLATRRKAA